MSEGYGDTLLQRETVYGLLLGLSFSYVYAAPWKLILIRSLSSSMVAIFMLGLLRINLDVRLAREWSTP